MTDDYLEHYGVKGMKWGVRNEDLDGVSSKTSREAKKDAQEFARAKMFYGEGAGTRRKLINNSVAAKSKKDPSYKKAFDHHLENQDLSKHASKARSERKRKDTVKTTAKTARGLRHIINDNAQYASLTAVVLFGAAGAAKSAGLDKKAAGLAKETYSSVKAWAQNRENMRAAQDFLRDLGM
jgi:hypothetical protein